MVEIEGREGMWCKEREEYVYEEDERELRGRLYEGVEVLYESVSYKREYCAKSGDYASVKYGRERIGGRDCYYVLTDDEGRSGYGCCGKIDLWYSYEIEKYLDKCYEIEKRDFERMREILGYEVVGNYVPKLEERIKGWLDDEEMNKGEEGVITLESWDWGGLNSNPSITPEFLDREGV